MTAAELLDAALAQVESASIREWVQSQRDIWIRLVATRIAEDARDQKVERMQIAIICEAIGL